MRLITSMKTSIDNIISNIVLILVLANVGICGYILRDTFHGDPTIYFIYSRNIRDGDFFAFNPGVFSSGSTSPLWAIILSFGFLFPEGILAGKIIACLFTCTALLVYYLTLKKIFDFPIGISLTTGVLCYYLFLPGLMVYETPLMVILVNFLIFLNYLIFSKHDFRYFWYLGIVWTFIPLARPEGFLLVVLNFLLLLFTFRNSKKQVLQSTLLFLLSSIPSLIYFGYSYLQTGTFSTSSYCRTFALKEMPFSLDNLERYFIPLLPFGLGIIVFILKRVFQRNIYPVLFLSLPLILMIMSLSIQRAKFEEQRGLTFDVIVEKDVIEFLNTIALPDVTVLAYEVQDRYYLRNDLFLLSLDGIVDGKIIPYFNDVQAFLIRYKPKYWIANDAVLYRPFLNKSILKDVYLSAIHPGSTFTTNGIRFTCIWLNQKYQKFHGFANAKAIFMIDYDE